MVSQTGVFAAVGAGISRGVEQAAATWNEDPSHRPVEVSTCDDQSTPEGGLACFRQLSESSDAIIGPHLFPSYRAVKDVVADSGPVLLTGVPFSEPPAGSYIFQTQPNIDDIVDGQLAYAASAGLTRVASITSNDQPGNIGRDAVAEQAEAHGVEVVAQETLDPQAQNIAPQAESIAAADPDAVISWTIGPALVNVLRALDAAGVEAPVLMGSGSMSAPILTEAGEQTPPTLLFVASAAFEPEAIEDADAQARVQAFNDAFVERFDQAPDNNAYLAADALFYAAEAGADAESTDDIRDRLASGEPLDSLLWGPYTYSEDDHVGQKGRDFSVLEWHLDSATWTIVE
jgi:branched-chain amino acid transport system substrate-binding protein